MQFKDLTVLSVFKCPSTGDKYVKQSTRTAHVYGYPDIWYYFCMNELVIRELR